MKKPPPSDAVLHKEARALAKRFTAEPYIAIEKRTDQDGIFPPGTPAFWGTMLDLIYSGNEAKAWQYLDWVWPSNKPGKEAFLSDFKDQLLDSAYGEIFKWKYRKAGPAPKP
jgi:hypothetical protein